MRSSSLLKSGSALIVVAVFGTIIARAVLRKRQKKQRKYVPYAYNNDALYPFERLLVVDSSHPTARQITHHLKGPAQKASMDLSLRGDTSTDGALNAILRTHPDFNKAEFVTANHFDIDAFIPVWACLHPDVAQKHERVLREVARIGDFRELRLDEPFQVTALKLACYLNSEERRLFYKPFEAGISLMEGEKEAVQKFEYFLKLFAGVVENPDAFKKAWSEEFKCVNEDYALVQASPFCAHSESDLIVQRLARPVHYYALFSRSRTFDIILTIYPNRRYEVEVKYTTMVDLNSRPCFPRVDMTALSKHLNMLEESRNAAFPKKYHWKADRFVDSGPMLRIESEEKGNLAKVDRYAHPYERDIYSSGIDENEIEQLVTSYFAFALEGMRRKKDWEWDELTAFNQKIEWDRWIRERLPGRLQQ